METRLESLDFYPTIKDISDHIILITSSAAVAHKVAPTMAYAVGAELSYLGFG